MIFNLMSHSSGGASASNAAKKTKSRTTASNEAKRLAAATAGNGKGAIKNSIDGR